MKRRFSGALWRLMEAKTVQQFAITVIRGSLFGRRLECANEELTAFDPDSKLSGSFPWNVDFGTQAHIYFLTPWESLNERG
jgi:hypothetical protein